jgi:hypothetical protein
VWYAQGYVLILMVVLEQRALRTAASQPGRECREIKRRIREDEIARSLPYGGLPLKHLCVPTSFCTSTSCIARGCCHACAVSVHLPPWTQQIKSEPPCSALQLTVVPRAFKVLPEIVGSATLRQPQCLAYNNQLLSC